MWKYIGVCSIIIAAVTFGIYSNWSFLSADGNEAFFGAAISLGGALVDGLIGGLGSFAGGVFGSMFQEQRNKSIVKFRLL